MSFALAAEPMLLTDANNEFCRGNRNGDRFMVVILSESIAKA